MVSISPQRRANNDASKGGGRRRRDKRPVSDVVVPASPGTAPPSVGPAIPSAPIPPAAPEPMPSVPPAAEPVAMPEPQLPQMPVEIPTVAPDYTESQVGAYAGPTPVADQAPPAEHYVTQAPDPDFVEHHYAQPLGAEPPYPDTAPPQAYADPVAPDPAHPEDAFSEAAYPESAPAQHYADPLAADPLAAEPPYPDAAPPQAYTDPLAPDQAYPEPPYAEQAYPEPAPEQHYAQPLAPEPSAPDQHYADPLAAEPPYPDTAPQQAYADPLAPDQAYPEPPYADQASTEPAPEQHYAQPLAPEPPYADQASTDPAPEQHYAQALAPEPPYPEQTYPDLAPQQAYADPAAPDQAYPELVPDQYLSTTDQVPGPATVEADEPQAEIYADAGIYTDVPDPAPAPPEQSPAQQYPSPPAADQPLPMAAPPQMYADQADATSYSPPLSPATYPSVGTEVGPAAAQSVAPGYAHASPPGPLAAQPSQYPVGVPERSGSWSSQSRRRKFGPFAVSVVIGLELLLIGLVALDAAQRRQITWSVAIAVAAPLTVIALLLIIPRRGRSLGAWMLARMSRSGRAVTVGSPEGGPYGVVPAVFPGVRVQQVRDPRGATFGVIRWRDTATALVAVRRSVTDISDPYPLGAVWDRLSDEESGIEAVTAVTAPMQADGATAMLLGVRLRLATATDAIAIRGGGERGVHAALAAALSTLDSLGTAAGWSVARLDSEAAKSSMTSILEPTVGLPEETWGFTWVKVVGPTLTHRMQVATRISPAADINLWRRAAPQMWTTVEVSRGAASYEGKAAPNVRVIARVADQTDRGATTAARSVRKVSGVSFTPITEDVMSAFRASTPVGDGQPPADGTQIRAGSSLQTWFQVNNDDLNSLLL